VVSLSQPVRAPGRIIYTCYSFGLCLAWQFFSLRAVVSVEAMMNNQRLSRLEITGILKFLFDFKSTKIFRLVNIDKLYFQ